jgi:hypothetical protein
MGFDTANPILNPDRSKPKPWPRQDPWEFWEHVRDYVTHIHIKDAVWNPTKKDGDYQWPGEGDGRVADILRTHLRGDMTPGSPLNLTWWWCFMTHSRRPQARKPC